MASHTVFSSVSNPHPADVAPSIEGPSTPSDPEGPLSASQVTLLSTEVPGSPVDPNVSFKTEPNDDRVGLPVIPSSLTPPPSSQQPTHAAPPAGGCVNGRGRGHSSQQSSLVSPPATVPTEPRRDGAAALASSATAEYVPPTSSQIADATMDELRDMVVSSAAVHKRLKMEAAHHRLQLQLASLQAGEDAQRHAVELEMVQREVEALREANQTRGLGRELTAMSEDAQDALFLQLRELRDRYEEARAENEKLGQRLRSALKLIRQADEVNFSLAEEKDMLLTRIKENREHFRELTSPGGIFHGAWTLKTPPQQQQQHPQQQQQQQQQQQYQHQHQQLHHPHNHNSAVTPHQQKAKPAAAKGHGQNTREPLSALLHVLSQEGNSEPSTPLTSGRPGSRIPAKHTRNVQSLSSLPTTPLGRPRGPHAGLLPSVDLVPQTEPPHRHYHATPFGATGAQSPIDRGRAPGDSRESTISAEDAEELARQALARARSIMASSHNSYRLSQRMDEEEDGDVDESRASQAASVMLRRDPRESFDVAASRDGTPTPADHTARMHAKLFGTVVGEKRKLEDPLPAPVPEKRRELPTSPKRARMPLPGHGRRHR